MEGKQKNRRNRRIRKETKERKETEARKRNRTTEKKQNKQKRNKRTEKKQKREKCLKPSLPLSMHCSHLETQSRFDNNLSHCHFHILYEPKNFLCFFSFYFWSSWLYLKTLFTQFDTVLDFLLSTLLTKCSLWKEIYLKSGYIHNFTSTRIRSGVFLFISANLRLCLPLTGGLDVGRETCESFDGGNTYFPPAFSIHPPYSLLFTHISNPLFFGQFHETF